MYYPHPVNSPLLESHLGDCISKTGDIPRCHHWFCAELHLRNQHINSIPKTHYYQELSGTSDCSCCMGNLLQPNRITTQISVLTHHQYRISMLVSQMSFCRETSGGIMKCQLFPQAMIALDCEQFLSLATAASSKKSKQRKGTACLLIILRKTRFTYCHGKVSLQKQPFLITLHSWGCFVGGNVCDSVTGIPY